MSELPELVDLSVIFPSLHIDLKYATADNITGAPIYREARCLLHTEAVTALAKSISIAQLAGLQLVVYDAYRPQQAQAILWNACPDPQYVVDVAIGSNHSRGTAIDVTLMDDRGHILEPGYEDYTCVKRFFPPRSDSRCVSVCPARRTGCRSQRYVGDW